MLHTVRANGAFAQFLNSLLPSHDFGSGQAPGQETTRTTGVRGKSGIPVLLFTFFLGSSAWAGVPTDDNTQNLTFGEFGYSVESQSIWGDSGPGRYELHFELTSEQWDAVFGRAPRVRLGVGAIEEVCLPLVDCVRAGAAAGIELETYFLPYLDLEFDPGTFDATVTYRPEVFYQYEGLGLDFSTLNTESGLVNSKSEFVLESPRLEFETGINIEANVNLFAEACLVVCFLDEKYNLYSDTFQLPLIVLSTDLDTDMDPDTTEPAFKIFYPNVDTPADAVIAIEQLVTQPIETLTDLLYVDAAAALKELAAGKAYDQLSPENQRRIDKLQGGPLSASLSFPYNSEDGTPIGFSGGVASGTIGGELLAVSLDIDEILGYAFGLKDGLKIDLETFQVTSPVSGFVELGNATAGPVIDLVTDVSLTPELMVDLQFDTEVLVKGKIGKQTSYQGSWEDLPQIALTADSYRLGKGESPEDKVVTATPAFSVAATVENHTYLDLTATAKLELLSAQIGIEGLPSLSIGPILEYEVQSDSLYQVDIFKDSFAVEDWTAADRVASGADADVLTFSAFGEIIFQARAEGPDGTDQFYGGDNDRNPFVGFNDKRIDQFLTSAEVIGYQRDNNPIYDFVFTENSDPSIESVRRSVGSSLADALTTLKLDNETAAHVMRDGLFTNDRGNSFVVEVGGGLELGKTNPYAPRSLASEGLALNTSPGGFVNEGTLQIFGDVFTNAGVDNPNYKFENAAKGTGPRTPTMLVGATGKVKFDGTFENHGFVNNYGDIELTAENNQTTNFFANRHGGDLDVYGGLALKRSRFSSMGNDGTLTVHTGGSLDVERVTARTDSSADIDNSGDLIVESGAQLRIYQTHNGEQGGAELRNLGRIDNSGYILNEGGQLISNGSSNLAFDSLLGANGDWKTGAAATARGTLESQLVDAQQAFAGVNKDMANQAANTFDARLDWLESGTGTVGQKLQASAAYVDQIDELEKYRRDDGLLEQAYDVVQELVTSARNTGFAVLENLAGGLLINEGTLENNAVVVNHTGGTLFNSGTLDNQGYVKNAGLLVNNEPATGMAGTLVNDGIVENGDKRIGLAGLSELVNLGKLENRGELINHDTVINYGVIDSTDPLGSGRTTETVVQNSGSLTNVGTIKNGADATYINAQGAETSNYGDIENNGVLENHGFINNGVAGTLPESIDSSVTATSAAGFYAGLQDLNKNNQALEQVNRQYQNEADRQRLNGFMGMLNEGEEGENARAWATFLYEKYLVSNLANTDQNGDNYGPGLESLEADRASIRSAVIAKGGAVGDACAAALLECYKTYFGSRQSDIPGVGGMTSAPNYDLAFATFNNQGIGDFQDYDLSIDWIEAFEANGTEWPNDERSDEKRFNWTLLMLLEAEGVSVPILDCVRSESCRRDPYQYYGGNLQSLKEFADGYGDLSRGVAIMGIDGLYANWIDKVFFDSDQYANKGAHLSLAEVSVYGSRADKLAQLYQARTQEVASIGQILDGSQLANAGFNFDNAMLSPFSTPESVNVELLLSRLDQALSSAKFDLSEVTALDANLNNRGTINNRGVINNRANLNNEEGGVINNSGALVIGATGTLTNAGEVLLNDFELANGDVQSGFLMSHGTIDNEAGGLIEIFSGTLVNGVLATQDDITNEITVLSTGVINNGGEIKLSASAQFIEVDDKAEFIYSNAVMINEGTLNNFAGALLQIGLDDMFMLENRLFSLNVSLNVLENSGDIYNDGTLANFGTIRNSGLIDNRAGSTFTNEGLINNTATGIISFEESASLGGEIVNNGLINMSENELLTLTGRVSGNGTFAGDTHLLGATVAPGNSPGLLTFAGDVIAENVDWLLEIWGTERGVAGGYDGVDIEGDLRLVDGMLLSIFSLLDFDAIRGQSFNFLSVGGNLINMGDAVTETTLSFAGFDGALLGFWDGEWVRSGGIWSLVLNFIGDEADYEQLYGRFQTAFNELFNAPPSGPGTGGPVADVPAPGTLSSLLLGVMLLGWMSAARRRGRRHDG